MVLPKERREIIFMISSVMLVAAIGLILQNVASDESHSSIAGLAVSLDSNAPTYSGIMHMLQESCSVVQGDSSSSCNSICESTGAICVPLEDNCNEVSNYDCYCCTDTSE